MYILRAKDLNKYINEPRHDKTKNRLNFGEVDVAPAKTDKVNKVEK